MTERSPKDKLRRSLSLKNKKKSDAKAGTSPTITSFFSSRPPPNLACPLCGQLVPRFKINDHIDLECQNFDRGNASGDGNDAPSAQLSPGSNLPKSPERDQNDEDTKTKTSPYFKRNNSQQTPRDINGKTVVRTIGLGSLSSKLSRKYPNKHAVVSKTPDQMSSEESPSSSQKENVQVQTLEDDNDCVSVLSSSADAPPATEAPSSVERQSEAVVASKEPTSPAKQTKRKKKGLSGVRESRMRKKAKCEGSSGESAEASSCLDPVDTNRELHESDALHSELLQESIPIKEEPAPESGAPSLPYYLRNFQTVLRAVFENEDDRKLFNQEDMLVVRRFQSLSGILWNH